MQRPSGRREGGGTRMFKARCLWACRTVSRRSMGLTVPGPEIQGSVASLGGIRRGCFIIMGSGVKNKSHTVLLGVIITHAKYPCSVSYNHLCFQI